MKRIKLGISLICLCFFLCGCEDIPSIIKGKESQIGNDRNPISVDDTIEEEKVDSVDFVNWINSFEIQPIDYVSVNSVIKDEGECIVYTHKTNSRESHRAGYFTTEGIILYDGLKIYGNDFIMIGNYREEHGYNSGGTIPVYVRKSEMLENWFVSYVRLDLFCRFNIHWSGEILRKRIMQEKDFHRSNL
jgi:hypothetical protein